MCSRFRGFCDHESVGLTLRWCKNTKFNPKMRDPFGACQYHQHIGLHVLFIDQEHTNFNEVISKWSPFLSDFLYWLFMNHTFKDAVVTHEQRHNVDCFLGGGWKLFGCVEQSFSQSRKCQTTPGKCIVVTEFVTAIAQQDLSRLTGLLIHIYSWTEPF